MPGFDDLRGKADDIAEKAGDVVDSKTGGRFAEQIDTAQEKAKEWSEGGEQQPEADQQDQQPQ
jgi:hypothetical protein